MLKCNTKETIRTIILIILIILIVTIGIMWMEFQWTECRENGLSFWYCVKHIS